MKTQLPLSIVALLLAWSTVACAPAADFKGGDPAADVATPDTGADAAVEASPDPGAEAAAPTACETDADCREAYKELSFPCHSPVCGEGACTWLPVADDTECDDGNDCTEDDACLDGQCLGAPVLCSQGANPCVQTLCEPGKGCTATRDTSGPCDDGDGCTLGDACAAGSCVPGLPLVCDDHNPCTSDACDDGACAFTPASGPCDDGNPCTTDDACVGGACAPGGWSTCGDLADLPCRRKVCEPVTGCGYETLPDGEPCDDDSLCTLDDACQGGTCSPALLRSCDDEDPCTTDACDPAVGCTATPKPEGSGCDDGNPCTTNDGCLGGVCTGQAKSCYDGNPCTVDLCDPLAGGCKGLPQDGLPCTDNDPCTVGDACVGGACASGPPKDCDDGNPCSTDACSAADGAGICTHKPGVAANPCDDGNPCTTNDACQPGKTTCGGTPKACNDGNPCTIDACDYRDGTCLYADAADGTPCSTEDMCVEDPHCEAGTCTGDALSCDDGDVCTADLCDPDGGCHHEPASLDPAEAGCLTEGVCAGLATVTCAANAPICHYDGVAAFEPDGEVSCDGRDNDCDGRVDEGLCGVCSVGERLCAGDDVLVCNSTGYGWEPERTCAAPATCRGAGACLPPGHVGVATGADPDPARAHGLTVDADGRLIVAVPRLEAGQRTVLVQRVLPDANVAEDLFLLGDVNVLALASTDARRVHVVFHLAGGSDLDLNVRTLEGATEVDADAHEVPGFQAVATPLVLDASTLAVPVATIVDLQLMLRVDRLDLAADEAETLGSLPYSEFLVKTLRATRQVDGDLALLYTTNTQQAALTRFRFASRDFLEPVVLPETPATIGVAAAEAAALLVTLERDEVGTLSATARPLADLAADGTGYLGATATATGAVRAWGRGEQVLVLWEGGTPAAPEIGAALVGAGGTVDPSPVPAGLEGFDPRYGRSPLGFEWISWRNAAGEVRFLAL